MFEIVDMYRVLRRMRAEPDELASVIEMEGGEVLERRLVGRIIPSPFPDLRIFPIQYEFRSSYGVRRGRWFVRTSGDKLAPDWVWADDSGDDTPIVSRPHLTASSEVRASGWIADLFLVGSIILIGLAAFIAIYLAFF